jgi:hypothetical protein
MTFSLEYFTINYRIKLHKNASTFNNIRYYILKKEEYIMSSTRKNEELETCNEYASLYKKLANEVCRKIPYGIFGTTPGATFKLIYTEDSCKKVSQAYVEQLKKCISLGQKKG